MKTTLKGSGLLAILFLLGASVSSFAATLSSVSPTAGPSSGGQTVRIRGTGFGATPVVTIGGQTAAIVANSATVIDVTTASGMTAGLGAILVDADTFNNAYTVISKNNTLVVNISATVAKRAQIQWGDATVIDDANVDHNGITLPGNAGTAADRISAFSWTVKDNGTLPAVNQIDIGTSYRSDDFNNNKTIAISNVSGTSSTANITAKAALTGGPLGLADGAAAAPDTYAVAASMGGAFALLGPTPNPTLSGAGLVSGTDQNLVIRVDAPTSVTNGNNVGTGQTTTFSVTLTAAAQ